MARSSLSFGAAAALVLAAWAAACSAPRDPIVLEEGVLTIQNQTGRDWQNVLITVNDHYTGGAPSLPAGARLNAPLSALHTGFGQPYDRRRQSVYKVVVTATDTAGSPVRVEWDGTRKPR